MTMDMEAQIIPPRPGSPLFNSMPYAPPQTYWAQSPRYAPQDTGIERETALGYHYRVREQIWDEDANDWLVFVPQLPKDFGDALFVVNHRRYTRRDDEEAFTVVDVLDGTLIEALRDVCQNVENIFATKPSLNLRTIYPYIDALAARAAELAAHDKAASAALESFLQVVADEFAPHREKLGRLLAEGKVTFEFLWAVFKPGSRIRVPHPHSRDPRDMIGAVVDDAREMSHTTPPKFRLRGRTLAWNGAQYEHVKWTHEIACFSGPTNLSDIDVSILTDEDRATLTERGRKYVQYTGIHHVDVTGRIIHMTGYTFGETPANGRAMLDTAAFKQPRRQPGMPHGPVPGPYLPPQVMPPSPPHSPGPRADGWGTPGRHARSSGQRVAEVHLPLDAVPEEMLWLLPPTLGGYSFAAKLWGEFRVDDIEPVVYDEDAWDRLVLDPETKTLIRSLVHVRARTDAHLLSDWIKGKGGGLVVLLHGVAGVGKTLTAEAVADLLHRPLYVVGSGELGYFANEVEPALKGALDLATKWSAVLLIDEADVFLEKRANADLMRNSLVATFLRLLEYHSGVLFLTTNRVKAFDEAFLSRVSVAIKYPELEINQRSRIWWQFLSHVLSSTPQATAGHALVPPDPETDLLGNENIKELAMKPFNGRIIKNIVRTAQALALSSDEPLSMRHLRTVMSVTEKFLRDTESVRNDAGDDEGLDPANEVVSLM